MDLWNMVIGSQKEGHYTEASHGKATRDFDYLSSQNYKVITSSALVTSC